MLIAVGLCVAVALTACTPRTASPPKDNTTAVAATRSVGIAAAPAATRPTTPPRAAPVRRPCVHNAARQLVLVRLAEQHMWLCSRKRQVLDTAITSGRAGEGTPIGTYRIQGRNRNSVLTLAGGRTYAVKYWIPFDAPNFGFHDSPWQTSAYGSRTYRAHGSHGCVHVPLPAIRLLYRWVELGARVTIVR